MTTTITKQIPYQALLNKYQQALQTKLPNHIQKLILYGSQVREEATNESDIDVLVVVNWEMERLPNGFYQAPFSDPRWQTIVNLAVDLCIEHGIYISPMVVTKKQFEEYSPLFNEIKREGVEIWTNTQS